MSFIKGENMHYIGSKKKLADFIYTTIRNTVPDLPNAIFCDLFAGTGYVGYYMKRFVKSVIANDLGYASYCLNQHYLLNSPSDIPNPQQIINEVNSLTPKNGFISQHYSPPNRMYFTTETAQKIDAIREFISEMCITNLLTHHEYYFLLASLIESADNHANTAATYESYLKKFSGKALKPFLVKPAEMEPSNPDNKVYNQDANELIKSIQGDVLYLDPPYNRRQYASVYHLLDTIAGNKQDFIPQGTIGKPPNCLSSAYSLKRTVKRAFEQLIADAKFKYIFMSYNNEGHMSLEEIKNIMSKYGNYSCISKKYRRHKTNKETPQDTPSHTIEYIHILIKP